MNWTIIWIFGGIAALIAALTFLSAYIESREIIEKEKSEKNRGGSQ